MLQLLLMSDFAKAYKNLNAAQKQAVDTIDGPVLVIAGPGTGKTQLLGMRVANILDKSDTLPQNILCLTFTESGAGNMRERLTRFIGQDAHNVSISTYHAFGGDLITRFPEFFKETRLESPVDQLGQHQTISSIVDGLRYDNPLKQTRHHLNDLLATISEVKRALLSKDDLRAIARENSKFTLRAGEHIAPIMEGVARMPGSYKKAVPYFQDILAALRPLVPAQPVNTEFGSLANLAVRELEIALETAEDTNSSKPLTAWKNSWLSKDATNNYALAGELKNQRIMALADVFEQYEAALAAHGLYDFDDMIIRSIKAMEESSELRFNLQEQYQYLLLDEFQDTNAAQLKLVQLLTDNPANEGRPNVLAVGDDDQAIYAFQGAQYSNMLDFYQMYRDVTVINLTENYRSHADVLHVAREIAEQIDERLHHHFEGASKQLTAANSHLPPTAHIDRHEFLSDVAEYDWVAQEVARLLDGGVNASEIAVLAPKHKQLEPLVAYLNKRDIPVRYEKRENILETPVVRQLITMSKLVLALHKGEHKLADSLWPEVLSYDFWQIPLAHIWRFSWKINDSKGELSWSKALLDDEKLRGPAMLLIALGMKVGAETLETMLDYLIGSSSLDIHDEHGRKMQSPLREYYTSAALRENQPEAFYETLSHLTVLRAKLDAYQRTMEQTLTLASLIEFVDMYAAAEQRITNASPYTQALESVQLMTVYKAKGLEFEHVFVLQALNDVWGESSRGGSNRLSLPANLLPIRRDAVTEDERLRILFVALTRAKIGLHITSHTTTYSGKSTHRLKYLNEQEQADGSHRTLVLPGPVQTVVTNDSDAPSLETLEQYWHARHLTGLRDVTMHDLLADRLAHYQVSPTDAGDFIDLENCGPESFFLKCIFRFPQAPSEHLDFGNAMHETLEWLQHQRDSLKKLPPEKTILERFREIMASKRLSQQQIELLTHRGEAALVQYLAARSIIFDRPAVVERSFRAENVFVGDAHLAGKIDRMEIDEKAKNITVVDYKTGKSEAKPKRDVKSLKHEQQLYCYKILIENSRTYKGYHVKTGRLEFLEPDEDGNINTHEIHFTAEETERTKILLQMVWRHVRTLSIPDVSEYPANIAGVIAFRNMLVDGEPASPK